MEAVVTDIHLALMPRTAVRTDPHRPATPTALHIAAQATARPTAVAAAATAALTHRQHTRGG